MKDFFFVVATVVLVIPVVAMVVLVLSRKGRGRERWKRMRKGKSFLFWDFFYTCKGGVKGVHVTCHITCHFSLSNGVRGLAQFC